MDWVVIAATVIIACSSVASLVVTWRLSQDNRILRRVGTEPEVVAYLAIDSRQGFLVNLVFENVGQGPARDVEYFVDADPRNFASGHLMRVSTGASRRIRSLLPQGERVERRLGVGHQLLGTDERPRLRPFDVRVSYSNLRGAGSTTKEYALDISEMEGSPVGAPNDKRIADSLRKIERHLSKMSFS